MPGRDFPSSDWFSRSEEEAQGKVTIMMWELISCAQQDGSDAAELHQLLGRNGKTHECWELWYYDESNELEVAKWQKWLSILYKQFSIKQSEREILQVWAGSSCDPALKVLMVCVWLSTGVTSWTSETTSSQWTASICRSFATMRSLACWRTSGSVWCWRWSTSCRHSVGEVLRGMIVCPEDSLLLGCYSYGGMETANL